MYITLTPTIAKKVAEEFQAKPVTALLPNNVKMIKNMICPICTRTVSGFRDNLSFKEYQISGMCQTCQDETFGF